MVKVSVIIPVYKTERYIERCARSLFKQTLDEVEYIFVDDCTPDKSIEILQTVIEEYPERKNLIKIISNGQNKGSATVRNIGLKVATGEYVIYCDSDDWVEPDMYEAMYCAAKADDADMVVADFYNEYVSGTVVQKQPYPGDGVACIRRILSGELHGGTWNKLVRRELYIRHNVRFPDEINMWEDVLTVIPLCFHASKIVYLDKAFYHYVRDNAASYTNSMKPESLQNLMDAVIRVGRFLDANGLSGLEKEFCYLKLTVKLNLLLNSKGEQQQLWNRLYPETATYIFSYTAMSIYWRVALKLASWNCISAFNVMAVAGKRILAAGKTYGKHS